MSDTTNTDPVSMHAWRDQTASWWYMQRVPEGGQVRINCMSSDIHAIPSTLRFAHYEYAGRVWVNRDVVVHGHRDAQIDMLLQQLDHMIAHLEQDEVPWDCFAFWSRTLKNNLRVQRRVWGSYDVDRKTSDVVRQLNSTQWRANVPVDRVRSSATRWMAMCERSVSVYR